MDHLRCGSQVPRSCEWLRTRSRESGAKFTSAAARLVVSQGKNTAAVSGSFLPARRHTIGGRPAWSLRFDRDGDFAGLLGSGGGNCRSNVDGSARLRADLDLNERREQSRAELRSGNLDSSITDAKERIKSSAWAKWRRNA
jgi:hypothetical protein